MITAGCTYSRIRVDEALCILVLREFAESLQTLKESFTPQMEDLTQIRNELIEEVSNLTQLKDRNFQEFEQVSSTAGERQRGARPEYAAPVHLATDTRIAAAGRVFFRASTSTTSDPQLSARGGGVVMAHMQIPKETHKLSKDVDPISGRKIVNQYEFVESLRSGQHGTVKLARDLNTDDYVAVKIVRRHPRKKGLRRTEETGEMTRKEIAILKKARPAMSST
ncbi:MAG: hypothetical protein L6R40_004742 [Gallowayella cf. fulva]|nr:MAG: hypothetical protein L6R40_004742 [Xanthomendoza cf. fulva]